jgi:hypothetical protein
MLLALFMPLAIPRVIVITPITIALAHRMGFATESRGYAGLCGVDRDGSHDGPGANLYVLNHKLAHDY